MPNLSLICNKIPIFVDMKIDRTKGIFFLTQIAFWVIFVMVIPLFYFVSTNSIDGLWQSLKTTFLLFLPWVVLYFLNYCLLIPFFLMRKGRRWAFYVINILLFAAMVTRIVINGRNMQLPPEVPVSSGWIVSMGAATQLVMQLFIVLMAVASKYMEKYLLMREAAARQKQQATEAELVWLKNQLNPHFLFNTLNNISSLTQIDADKAQESLGKFSELLRYALYESEAEMVPLSNELAFMENYIDLMSLRCNELTKITKEFVCPSGDMKVAPLIFISLIENAFKHGVNSRSESFVEISLKVEGRDLVFTCRNSVFEKSGSDRIGSGIGLSNMKKRLELIYQGRYEYEFGNDGKVYYARIILKGIC